MFLGAESEFSPSETPQPISRQKILSDNQSVPYNVLILFQERPVGASDQTASARRRRRDEAHAQRLARAERRHALFELVVSGHSYAAIARDSGTSLKALRRLVDREIADRRLDAPDRHIRLQVARIEKALVVADAAIEAGNVRAVSQYLKAVAALDRYHGVAAALAPPSAPPPPAPPQLSAPAAPLALTHAAAPVAAEAEALAVETKNGA